MGRVVVDGVPALILTGQAAVPCVAHSLALLVRFERPPTVTGRPADNHPAGAEPVTVRPPPRPG